MKQKKKLLIVIGSLSRGGCELHLLRVLPELVLRGYDIKIFLLAFPGPLAVQMEENGVPIIKPWVKSFGSNRQSIAFRVFRLFVISLQLMVYNLTRRPNIIHFFLPESYWLGAPILWASFGKNLVMSRRSQNNYMDGRPVIAKLERFFHKRMKAVLGNSKEVIRQLIVEEGAPTERVCLIYNGINLPNPSEENRTTIRQELIGDADRVVMTIVANLIPYKGHRDLFLALELLKGAEGNNWQLLVVGRDDGIGDDLLSFVDDLGLRDNVSFLGARSDVEDILAISDIGLLVSHEEGFSNAILECMAAGLPMVVTNVGGNAEAVVDGETGYVVPAKNKEALMKAVSLLLNNRILRQNMGCRGRERVKTQFSIEKSVQNYDELYSALLLDKSVECLPEISAKFHEIT